MLLPPALQLLPIVPPNQSDSGSFDGVLELLVRTGRDIAQVRLPLGFLGPCRRQWSRPYHSGHAR